MHFWPCIYFYTGKSLTKRPHNGVINDLLKKIVGDGCFDYQLYGN